MMKARGCRAAAGQSQFILIEKAWKRNTPSQASAHGSFHARHEQDMQTTAANTNAVATACEYSHCRRKSIRHRVRPSSGGGKSTLLAELRRRGHAVIEEPGRRIVQEQTRTGGQALPWLDITAFLRRAIDLAVNDHATAPRDNSQWVFFDRSLIDAAAALPSPCSAGASGPTR